MSKDKKPVENNYFVVVRSRFGQRYVYAGTAEEVKEQLDDSANGEENCDDES